MSADGRLVVALSSRALFDFEEENRVFEAGDDRAYMRLQLDRLNEPARPGVAFSLASKLLAFNAAGMAALVTLLLDRLPIDPFVHPMAPLLSGTPWLAIHVPIIMVSYSTFAIATFLAHMQLGVGLFAPRQSARVQKWSQLLYWYLMVGSILLIAGILTGSIWAASSWGRYWGWDPKDLLP